MLNIRIKGWFYFFLCITILLCCRMLASIRDIPKWDSSNWQECEGYIVEKSYTRKIISYSENENIHYSLMTDLSLNDESDLSKPISMYYYKNNPEICAYSIDNGYKLLFFMLLIATIFVGGMTAICYEYLSLPKKGKKVTLEYVNTTSGYGIYKFKLERDNKIKYLKDPYKSYIYKEILDLCNIKEVNCYVKGEKSRLCYADFEETFENNNISISVSNMGGETL